VLKHATPRECAAAAAAAAPMSGDECEPGPGPGDDDDDELRRSWRCTRGGSCDALPLPLPSAAPDAADDDDGSWLLLPSASSCSEEYCRCVRGACDRRATWRSIRISSRSVVGDDELERPTRFAERRPLPSRVAAVLLLLWLWLWLPLLFVLFVTKVGGVVIDCAAAGSAVAAPRRVLSLKACHRMCCCAAAAAAAAVAEGSDPRRDAGSKGDAATTGCRPGMLMRVFFFFVFGETLQSSSFYCRRGDE
jgi:hypothetical protein